MNARLLPRGQAPNLEPCSCPKSSCHEGLAEGNSHKSGYRKLPDETEKAAWSASVMQSEEADQRTSGLAVKPHHADTRAAGVEQSRQCLIKPGIMRGVDAVKS
ncbi:hypothetical protein SRHO_G00018430 [Serrasalmus rhombeus]